jgi:hypothetical protein
MNRVITKTGHCNPCFTFIPGQWRNKEISTTRLRVIRVSPLYTQALRDLFSQTRHQVDNRCVEYLIGNSVNGIIEIKGFRELNKDNKEIIIK